MCISGLVYLSDDLYFNFFTIRKQSCGKVMFSQVYAENSVQGGCPGPGASPEGGCLPGRGVQTQALGVVGVQAQAYSRGDPGPGPG